MAGLIALGASGAAAQGGAVFVSPTGSDANSGLTPDQPFQTLEHARDAARGSPAKTVYLEGGVYLRTAPLMLTGADAGESWLGFHGQTPVLDGGGTVKRGIDFAAPHITLRWLTLRRYAESGVFAENAPDAVIDSNVVRDTRSTGWNQGGIVSIGNFMNGRITHNLVQNSRYAGIMAATTPQDSITGLTIQDNAVYDTCTAVADCGGLYADDRGHASTDIRIDHNIVGRYGSARLISKAIYLDDLLSNAAVTNNIVYGNGQYAIQVHGGDHNRVENNIFDVRQATGAVLYQRRSPMLSMEANVFRCNIIYSAHARPRDLWEIVSNGTPATEDKDIYWVGAGRHAKSGDRRPGARGDFVGPDSHNYALRSALAANYCGFKPISPDGIGPLPNP